MALTLPSGNMPGALKKILLARLSGKSRALPLKENVSAVARHAEEAPFENKEWFQELMLRDKYSDPGVVRPLGEGSNMDIGNRIWRSPDLPTIPPPPPAPPLLPGPDDYKIPVIPSATPPNPLGEVYTPAMAPRAFSIEELVPMLKNAKATGNEDLVRRLSILIEKEKQSAIQRARNEATAGQVSGPAFSTLGQTPPATPLEELMQASGKAPGIRQVPVGEPVIHPDLATALSTTKGLGITSPGMRGVDVPATELEKMFPALAEQNKGMTLPRMDADNIGHTVARLGDLDPELLKQVQKTETQLDLPSKNQFYAKMGDSKAIRTYNNKTEFYADLLSYARKQVKEGGVLKVDGNPTDVSRRTDFSTGRVFDPKTGEAHELTRRPMLSAAENTILNDILGNGQGNLQKKMQKAGIELPNEIDAIKLTFEAGELADAVNLAAFAKAAKPMYGATGESGANKVRFMRDWILWRSDPKKFEDFLEGIATKEGKTVKGQNAKNIEWNEKGRHDAAREAWINLKKERDETIAKLKQDGLSKDEIKAEMEDLFDMDIRSATDMATLPEFAPKTLLKESGRDATALIAYFKMLKKQYDITKISKRLQEATKEMEKIAKTKEFKEQEYLPSRPIDMSNASTDMTKTGPPRSAIERARDAFLEKNRLRVEQKKRDLQVITRKLKQRGGKPEEIE